MKKILTTYKTKLLAKGLVALPPGGPFRAGQRVFAQVKNDAIFLTKKPVGPLSGKRRISMRIRRVTAASRNVMSAKPVFRKALNSGSICF